MKGVKSLYIKSLSDLHILEFQELDRYDYDIDFTLFDEEFRIFVTDINFNVDYHPNDYRFKNLKFVFDSHFNDNFNDRYFLMRNNKVTSRLLESTKPFDLKLFKNVVHELFKYEIEEITEIPKFVDTIFID